MSSEKHRVIHIFGASGSGTSSLAKAICDKTGFYLMEVARIYEAKLSMMNGKGN